MILLSASPTSQKMLSVSPSTEPPVPQRDFLLLLVPPEVPEGHGAQFGGSELDPPIL